MCIRDSLIVGDFKFDVKYPTKDTYYLTTKRHSLQYKCIVLWRNSFRWKWCGVAHTIVKCLDKPNYETSEELVCNDVYLHSRDTGNRSTDPLKYFKDGERLQKQFFDTLYDDPDGLNDRSVFYAGQSYLDAGEYELALKYLSKNNSNYKPIFVHQEMSSSYLSYAMSVIVSRALPDVRDGLKPVHRRIIYAMYKGGYDWGKPFRKSARIVGDVIGKYHPHGDQAVYDLSLIHI